MDPVTLITTLWEVTKSFVIRFYDPSDNDPFNRPNNHPHPVNNNTASNYDREDHPHHSARTQKKIMNKLHHLAKNGINPFNNLTPEQNLAILLFGMSMVPASASAASVTLTALTIGPVAEAFTIDVLANAAFAQAATRAGAIVAAGKALELNSIFTVPKAANMLSPAELKYLKQFRPKDLVRMAIRKGVDTVKDSLVLWSNLKTRGVQVSQDFVKANGGMTLEMTPGGKWLNDLNLFAENSPFSWPERMQIWEEVSVAAIKRASGQVRSIVGAGPLDTEAIFQAELRAIEDNLLITGHDRLTIGPRLILHGI